MALLRKQFRSAVGLDIGARRIKAVQLETVARAADSSTSATSWRVTAATSINRASPGEPVTVDEAARVCDTLDRLGFIGSRVTIAAPADKLFAGMLELPKIGGGGQIPLEQIARVELARTNKVAPDSFEMGCWELPVAARAGKTIQVMAVGYPHAEATQFLDVLESAGLEVSALDVRTCAMARACASAAATPPGITALLDLGWSSASLVLLYSGMIVYVRALSEAGMSRVHDALTKRLRLEPEMVDYVLGDVGIHDAASDARQLELPNDARSLLTTCADTLVRELLVSFSYVARQYTDASVTRLLLTGAGAAIPGLGDALSGQLGLEARPIAPKDLAECPASLLELCSSPELTPALGLAMFPDT